MRSCLGSWYSKRNTKSIDAIIKAKYYRRLVACGSPGFTNTGKLFWNRCSSALCAKCSWAWSLKQAQNLITCFPDSVNEDFVFITVGIGLTHDINEIFPMFDKLRSSVRNDANNLRDRKKIEFLPWHNFGLAGALEIDHFKASDFMFLGSRKREQYEKQFGYVRDKTKSDDVWVATGHFVCHRGNLTDSDIDKLFDKHVKFCHFTELHKDNSRDFNIRKMLKYASKVQFGDFLPDHIFRKDRIKYWDKAVMEQYGSIMLRSSGRNAFKFSMMRKGYRSRSSNKTR